MQRDFFSPRVTTITRKRAKGQKVVRPELSAPTCGARRRWRSGRWRCCIRVMSDDHHFRPSSVWPRVQTRGPPTASTAWRNSDRSAFACSPTSAGVILRCAVSVVPSDISSARVISRRSSGPSLRTRNGGAQPASFPVSAWAVASVRIQYRNIRKYSPVHYRFGTQNFGRYHFFELYLCSVEVFGLGSIFRRLTYVIFLHTLTYCVFRTHFVLRFNVQIR